MSESELDHLDPTGLDDSALDEAEWSALGVCGPATLAKFRDEQSRRPRPEVPGP